MIAFPGQPRRADRRAERPRCCRSPTCSAAYGRIEVVHGVSLEVPEGSVYALLGPNGAGKSTLLKVASGRMPATAGTVSFDGEEIRRPCPTAWPAGACAPCPKAAPSSRT